MMKHPILQSDIIQEAIPGNIRKAEHFLPVMRKVIVFFKELMKSRELQILSPLKVVFKLQE